MSVDNGEKYRGLDWAWKLIAMADSTNAPKQDYEYRGYCQRPFKLENGWTVVLFYRTATDLSYIDHFIDPDGLEVQFWDWTDDHRDYDHDSDRGLLMSWSGVGSLVQDAA